MPKVTDKSVRGGRKQRGQGTKKKGPAKPKSQGKNRKTVAVDKDEVLNETNQEFDEPEKRFRGANWTRPELVNLFVAANARRGFIKGAYEYHSGGNDSRARAWKEVEAYVNEVSVQPRTEKQCKNKITDFVKESKEKLRTLKSAMAKTGRAAVEITDDMRLLPEETMALDYAGDEAVTGIPGTRASTLFRLRPKRLKPVPWSSYRANKMDYYKAFKANKDDAVDEIVIDSD